MIDKGSQRDDVLDPTDERELVRKEIGNSVGMWETISEEGGVSIHRSVVGVDKHADNDGMFLHVPTHSEDMMMPLTGNEPHSTLRAKGQLTIPPEIRQAAHLEENAPVYFMITDQGVLLRPGKVIDASQAWFWSDRWQQMEREADASFAAGRHKTFDDAESFLADLDS